jgi:hypothetical protein
MCILKARQAPVIFQSNSLKTPADIAFKSTVFAKTTYNGWLYNLCVMLVVQA